MQKKPDIVVRYQVCYEVDVPIHGCHSPELYEQKVLHDAKQVRENLLYNLFGNGGLHDYDSQPYEPVDRSAVKFKFIAFKERLERDATEGLLPPPQIVRITEVS